MEFGIQSPKSIDLQFDRDDLVGISLGGEDPIFKRGLALDNMYRGIVDESGVVGTMGIEDCIDSAVENDDDLEVDPGVMDMVPDETDLAMDAIDADEEIEANQDIMSGEADDDVDLLDLVDSMPLQEEVKNVTSKDVQASIQGKLNASPKNSVTAKDIEKATKSETEEPVSEDAEEEETVETIGMLELMFDV